MDSMQLSAVKGASPKRSFPVGASTVRRYVWGDPPKRAFVSASEVKSGVSSAGSIPQDEFILCKRRHPANLR
jgi:hypothetical protein